MTLPDSLATQSTSKLSSRSLLRHLAILFANFDDALARLEITNCQIHLFQLEALTKFPLDLVHRDRRLMRIN